MNGGRERERGVQLVCRCVGVCRCRCVCVYVSLIATVTDPVVMIIRMMIELRAQDRRA